MAGEQSMPEPVEGERRGLVSKELESLSEEKEVVAEEVMEWPHSQEELEVSNRQVLEAVAESQGIRT